MDFGALPPEIDSPRMYSGPRAGSMLDAADAWDRLADELYSTAISYRAIITTLTDDDWRGSPADSMAAAVRNVRWLTNTAAQAEEGRQPGQGCCKRLRDRVRRDGAPAHDRGQQGSAGIADRG